jgi:hypothetical protein
LSIIFPAAEIEFDVPTVSWGSARESVHRHVGSEAERDAAIPNASMNDEGFNIDP